MMLCSAVACKVSFWDVMPTMAELIGVEVPETANIDGLSFLGLLKGGEAEKELLSTLQLS